MNILYLSTVFPESSDTSTIYTDLAEELAKEHKIYVVTNAEKKRNKETYICQERGCTVLRVKTGNQYNVGFVEKGITIIMLGFLFRKAIRKYFSRKKFDLILYETPPITLYGVVKFAKKKYHAHCFLMLKDIFPQNGVDLGIIRKNGFIYWYFRKLEKKIYQVSDTIGCMSKGNIDYIKAHNTIEDNKLILFPNTKRIKNHQQRNINILSKYHIPQNKIRFIFGGNMGRPQGVRFLAKCIYACKDIPDAFFLLIGRGTEKEMVRSMLTGCENSLVIDELPRNDYEELLIQCDVGIVSLAYDFTIPNYPSRILSYMEFGIPTLAMTDTVTDFKELIEAANCGIWIPSNSEEKFRESIQMLLDKEKRKVMGANGKKYLQEHFSVLKSVDIINRIMDNS